MLVKRDAERTVWICAALAAVTLAVYWRAGQNAFVEFDDPAYLLTNANIHGGVTWECVKWAFTTGYANNWHPLTWLSHALDWQLFGANAGGHHLVSVGFHVLNSVLLFLALRRLVGMVRSPKSEVQSLKSKVQSPKSSALRCAVVAGLFALHPLHVESVAWAAERKDVLSAFFFFLTLLAYAKHVEIRNPKSEIRKKSEIRNPKSEVSLDPSTLNSSPRQSGLSRQSTAAAEATAGQPSTKLWYLLALAAFALGLMSKPTLVTVPFVLLLLDWWPLGRFTENRESGKRKAETDGGKAESGELKSGKRESEKAETGGEDEHRTSNFEPRTLNGAALTEDRGQRTEDGGVQGSKFVFLLWEKFPFFILSAASCVATLLAQKHAVVMHILTFQDRVANGLVAYARYLGQMFWPVDLAVFYPHPVHWAAWKVVGSAGLLAMISLLALWQGRRRAYLAAGWLWFLGMLVPMIGLIQVGIQTRADRYTYLPSIGLFIALTWLIGDWAAEPGEAKSEDGRAESGLTKQSAIVNRKSKIGLAVAVLGACAWLTARQVGYWHDTETLFRHAAEVVPNNDLAYYNVGVQLNARGDPEGALENFRKAYEASATPETLQNLGYTLALLGRYQEAVTCYEGVLRMQPDDVEVNLDMGVALVALGKPQEAMVYYQRVLKLQPEHPGALNNLGIALATQGKLDEAVKCFQAAIRSTPDDPGSHQNLGRALEGMGKADEAIHEFGEAARLDPGNPGAHFNLGMALALKGRREEAKAELGQALRLKPDFQEARQQLELLSAPPQEKLR